MKESAHPRVKPTHLQRLAVVYLRQSTALQLRENPGSTAFQHGQREHAIRLGWPESAVVEVDEDLGLSGTSSEQRAGWRRLLKMVAAREVGAIFVTDPTRLSRSAADAEELLALCRATDTLLVVEGSIYDLGNPSDRLVLRIRFDVGVFDNEDRAHRFVQTKRALAEKGCAVTLRPTGYVVVDKGKWAKDPNEAVRQAIEEVFRQYQLLGTVGKVLRHFVTQGLKLPVRPAAQDRNPTLEPHWVRPTSHRIHYILTNPAYAGYYVYGRRPHYPGTYPDKDVRRRTSWGDWIVVPNHHEPYIDPTEWHAICERLKRNRVTVRQPAGTGPALCQGLLRCGRCGRRMRVQYYRRPKAGTGFTYVCAQAYVHYGEPKCWSMHGPSLDAVVAAEVLRCLESPEVDAVLAAAGDVNQAYEAARRQREAELARVQYQGRIARERYENVDPRHRLVAATLEQQWEEAKATLREMERRYEAEPLRAPLEVTAEILEAIHNLARDVPGLWAASSTTDQDRKTLIRLLVEEVRILRMRETDCEVEIVWVGGATSRHTVYHPWAAGVLAHELTAQGLDEVQVAEALNKLGLKTIERHGCYTPLAVRSLLRSAARRRRSGAQKRRRELWNGPGDGR